MIETARLALRSWRAEDRAPFVTLCQAPEVMAYLGGPAREDQIDGSIARARASELKNNFCFWVVERKEDQAFLGYCGLKIVDAPGAPIAGEIEIGWRIRQDAWGQGYAREAALATLRWAWANVGAPRIVAMTVPANQRSWGLMERIGMTHRPELDFGHPLFVETHPLHRHIVYAIDRPIDRLA